MARVPPPLPATAAARFEELLSQCAEPAELVAAQRGAWTVASGALLDSPAIEVEPVGEQDRSAEAELAAQVAHGSAQLQLALGRLAGIRAVVEGIEAALAALAVAGDCPACRSGEIRAAIARVRALADAP